MINTELWTSNEAVDFLIFGLGDFELKKTNKNRFHYKSYRMKTRTMSNRDKENSQAEVNGKYDFPSNFRFTTPLNI